MQDSELSITGEGVKQLPRLARQRLHDTVIEHLRSFIIEGTLGAGTKLNERELCETLGISRTPLREALKVLAAEGLIDGGGIWAELSDDQLRRDLRAFFARLTL